MSRPEHEKRTLWADRGPQGADVGAWRCAAHYSLEKIDSMPITEERKEVYRAERLKYEAFGETLQ